jgi:hypothetical protein
MPNVFKINGFPPKEVEPLYIFSLLHETNIITTVKIFIFMHKNIHICYRLKVCRVFYLPNFAFDKLTAAKRLFVKLSL